MIKIEQAPYFELPFLNAAPGRQRVAVRERLPFLRAVVSGLPPGAPPIVATADLQGRSEFGDTDDSLLGCAVADALPEIQTAAGLHAPEASLGLLAGDFYSIDGFRGLDRLRPRPLGRAGAAVRSRDRPERRRRRGHAGPGGLNA